MSVDRPFRFTHRWAVPADARSVLALLADPAGYPRWWPAVPRAHRLGPDRAAVRLRGLVPVRLTMERLIDDRARGLLVAHLSGDLTGTVRVTVHDDGAPAGHAPHCVVTWEQEVVLTSPWMRAVARVPGARTAMGLSHAAAMRSARRALGAKAVPTADPARTTRP
ncbi:SRPBCC family protein [Micrococcus yunnanensis]|uniref:SRPBCC family protein n=1 Tax=Micrococcus yunnanensis TaxID=566027 RepID=UPI0020232D25|nr:SRPBCC family protein [Micrococcus yunnanensis]URI27981.1 SRPBCC family protein [Micrococcus yunnanensis]